jgi:hypothetical protein
VLNFLTKAINVLDWANDNHTRDRRETRDGRFAF